jgi:hypothetical protein
MSVHLPHPRALRVAFTLAAAVSAASPVAAYAADAPRRDYAFDTTNTSVAPTSAVKVAADGGEVLFNLSTGVYSRNIRTGVTTRVLADGNVAVGASDDLRTLLVRTAANVDPADKNNQYDLYLYQRSTGVATLASRTKTGGPATGGASPGHEYDSPADLLNPILSGDGTVVLFDAATISNAVVTAAVQRRFDAKTATITDIAPAQSLSYYGSETNTTGTVAVNGAGIFVGTKKLPLPAGFNLAVSGSTRSAVSPDGSAVAIEDGSPSGRLYVVQTSTGTSRSVALPAWLKAEGHQLLGLKNGGGTALFGTILARPTVGSRYVLGTLDTTTGVLAQTGGDLLASYIDDLTPNLITQDWSFAVNESGLFQVGSTPIPASTAVTGATDYLGFTDATCVNFYGKQWTAASLTLHGVAGALAPVRADVTVKSTVTGNVANQFVLTPAAPTKSLAVGHNGGFVYTAKVLLANGATVIGSATVPVHATPACYTIYL